MNDDARSNGDARENDGDRENDENVPLTCLDGEFHPIRHDKGVLPTIRAGDAPAIPHCGELHLNYELMSASANARENENAFRNVLLSSGTSHTHCERIAESGVTALHDDAILLPLRPPLLRLHYVGFPLGPDESNPRSSPPYANRPKGIRPPSPICRAKFFCLHCVRAKKDLRL